jgi:hypothetical protein
MKTPSTVSAERILLRHSASAAEDSVIFAKPFVAASAARNGALRCAMMAVSTATCARACS